MTTATTTRHYDVASFGPFAELLQYEHNGKPGKCFVGEVVRSTSMEISLNRLPAGREMPFTHTHVNNEEILVITRGSGEVWLDGETIPVREGSVVRMAPQSERAWRASAHEDLYFLCIQAPAGGMTPAKTADGRMGQSPVPWV